MRLISILFFLLSFNLTYAQNHIPEKIRLLTQYQSPYDGPNCFNASLVAKGYMNTIQYVDGMEFLFYLDKFCQQQKQNLLSRGNVLVYFGKESYFEDEPSNGLQILHSSISLGEAQIFEKTSIDGVHSQKLDQADRPGRYEVKKINDSPFSGDSGQNNGVKIRLSYACISSHIVRTQIEKLNSKSAINRLILFRSKFNQAILAPHGPDKEATKKELDDFIKIVESVKGTSEADLYLAAISKSVLGTVNSFMDEKETNYDQNLHESLIFLQEATFDLLSRLRKHAKNPRIVKLLNQADI
tara:strand:- start:5532 stop:6425 length:894 start_codon:yes stop_codon:yes gene_type:complete